MIRLQPTSISLSDNELQYALQQLDKYKSLRQQGFTKGEINRYCAQVERETRIASNYQHQRAPTCVEMISSRRTAITEPLFESTALMPDYEVFLESPAAIQDTLTSRYAPGQSSLLRFAKNISPNASASEEPGETPDRVFKSSPSTQRLLYRSRSKTDSYLNSEVDDVHASSPVKVLEYDLSQPTLESTQTTDGQTAKLQQLETVDRLCATPVRLNRPASSPLRSQAEVLYPQTLPPPFSMTRRASSSPFNLPSTSRLSTTMHSDYETHSRFTTSLRIHMPTPRTSSLSSAYLAASPISPEQSLSPYQSSNPATSHGLWLMHSPLTPMQGAGVVLTRTEPRNFRNQHFDSSAIDGAPFAVYDDSLPAASQPQTPADLSRTEILTEGDAAYTAPPGRILSGAMSRLGLGDGPSVSQSEQSPTIRAIQMRARQNREFLRRSRAGIQRWARDEEEMTARLRNHGPNGSGSGLRDMWRDGLDVDRVGDENFEDEADFRRTIRIVRGGRIIDTVGRRMSREDGQQ